jgi:DNA polymerase III delta prime subunit
VLPVDKMSYDFSNLWIEKFRPRALNDFICTPFIKESLLSFKSKEEIPNLLFTGAAGIGKTSVAKIIVNDILECQYLYINASDENGIDTIRHKVINFAQTMSIDGKIKVIILDECDGLSIDAQRALRNTMEEFAGITRFILTANYKYKIIPALQSRCQSFDLTPPLDLAVKRCASILKQENIIVPDDQKIKLVEFIKGTYPDLRKCINEIQKFSSSGTLTLTDTKNNKVLELIFREIKKKNVETLRKALIESEHTFNSDYTSLLRNLFNYIDETETSADLKRFYLLTLSEYLYRDSFVVDKEINCYACLIQLSEIKL